MKIIFDFDDVLFNNTAQFKEHIFKCLEDAGVPRVTAEGEYLSVRKTDIPFSLKRFLALLAVKNGLDMEKMRALYEDIMAPVKSFLNPALIQIAKNAGAENCFLVTNGEEGFQEDKIERTEVSKLFKEIFIVPEGKKIIIDDIYNKNPNEKIIFVEDRSRFIDELDLSKYPNLKIVHFNKDGLDKLNQAIGLN